MEQPAEESIIADEADKVITSFDFAGFDPAVTGTIDEENKMITLIVPCGTDLTALVPTIDHTGMSISPDSGEAADFTDPVIFTVTAEDSSTQDYIVMVTAAEELPEDIAENKEPERLMSGMGAVPVAGFGKTIEFNGINYVEIPNNPSHNITNNFTVEFWFKPANTTQDGKYLVSRNGLYPDKQWGVIYEFTNDKVEFYAHGNGFTGSDPRAGSAMSISDTNWHHIAYTYNGTNLCGYLDGEQKFSVGRTFKLSTADNNLIGSRH